MLPAERATSPGGINANFKNPVDFRGHDVTPWTVRSPMPSPTIFPLEPVRTDGWFERIGEGIGSFSALCEIVGEHFFAFSIIVGARITALTVDRRNPDQTLVDFVVGAAEGASEKDLEPQRLTLADFRRRLAGALLVEEDREPPKPTKAGGTEAIQTYIGVRYLLLAPLYGYTLETLTLTGDHAELSLKFDGSTDSCDLETFRAKIRAHIRDDLEKSAAGAKSAIDLSKVGEAETAANASDWTKVVTLLGSWPAPLAIFLRTPEGQMLAPDARAMIAKGLGLLGSACVHLGEIEQAEEVFRIGIQYAQEGLAAAELFTRLGEALLTNGRAGEAIGPLRRAVAFGGKTERVMPLLARAFVERGRYVAAYVCVREALGAGASANDLKDAIHTIETKLGPTLGKWKTKLAKSA